MVIVSTLGMAGELKPLPNLGQTHLLSDGNVARFSGVGGRVRTMLARSFGVSAVGITPATLIVLLATTVASTFSGILLGPSEICIDCWRLLLDLVPIWYLIMKGV